MLWIQAHYICFIEKVLMHQVRCCEGKSALSTVGIMQRVLAITLVFYVPSCCSKGESVQSTLGILLCIVGTVLAFDVQITLLGG